MKKKVLSISMLVVTAFVATMISCSAKNEPSSDKTNGCTCEYYDPYDHESWTVNFSQSDMSQYGVSNCGALSSAIQADSYGGDFSVRCHE